MKRSVTCLPTFFFQLVFNLAVDCAAHTIATQLTSQTYFPPILRRGSGPVHTNVAGITITRLRKHTGQRPERRCNCKGGRTEKERVFHVTVGGGGCCRPGRVQASRERDAVAAPVAWSYLIIVFFRTTRLKFQI
jgi:hypothetical protein